MAAGRQKAEGGGRLHKFAENAREEEELAPFGWCAGAPKKRSFKTLPLRGLTHLPLY